jgi:hypothetical protein
MDPVSTTDDPRDREPRPSTQRPSAQGPSTQGTSARGLAAQRLSASYRPSLRRVTATQPGAGSRRRLQVAVGVIAAIGVGVAYGYAVAPAAAAPQNTAAPKTTAVRTATVVCPEITGPSDANVNAFTPQGVTGASAPAPGDTATLTAQSAKSPLATLKQPGSLSVNGGLSGDVANINQESIPVVGKADGGYAPGFTVTETLANGTTTSLHGLASTPCTAPDTEFWYLGADPSTKPNATINLYNSDQIAAQVNLAAFTANGPVSSTTMQLGQGIVVSPGNQLDHPIDLGNFSSSGQPVAVHVLTTAGRVSSALLDSDGLAGRDFIQAQRPAAHQVLPGVPAPTAKPASPMKLQLILFSPNADTDVTLHWIGGSKITPTVTVPHLTAGRVEQVDISKVPAVGEAGALQIDSSNNTPFLAEIKVAGEGGGDVAYLSPVPALAGESIIADDNGGSVVELTNSDTHDAQVKVTTEGSGTPATQTVTVPAQTTKAVTLQAPKGAPTFALSVTPLGGASAVYAARVMTSGGMITIQPMSTALETVQIPPVLNDLSGVVPQ